MTHQIIVSTEGSLGVIDLNRPEAINALSREMIDAIAAQLSAWRDDGAIRVVLFAGNGPKGFCAGGDVRAARAMVVSGDVLGAAGYFAAEYAMNALIAGYPKPIIALTHGVVMGGGIGIAGHCRYRITQPGSRFAMPEAAIGFFTDVGVNAILAKAPLNRALLFAMSGQAVGAEDALALGLADCIVKPEHVPAIRAGLATAAASHRPDEAIVALMQAESISGEAASFVTLADALPAEPPGSPSDFIERVAAQPTLSAISALLAMRSPTALTAIFHAQMAARRVMDVGRALEMDLRLAVLMASLPDFAEGVRSVLVDKDGKPNWSPTGLGEVDAKAILSAVEGA
ncbi:MAG: 3-hydroxyisobutyryl-CoA hydrolase [Devosia sp.]